MSGIDVGEDDVSIETIRDVCIDGPGHYLGHPQTLSVMQAEYVYPNSQRRNAPKAWYELDRPDLLANAVAREEAILSMPDAGGISPDVDARIRHRFNVHLNLTKTMPE